MTERMTPAERKFKIGYRVRLSSEGRRLLVPGRKKMGPNTMATVVGYFAPLGVLLNVDGYKAKKVAYHIDFWEQ